MKKRVLSLFMAFVLCLTLLPTSAFAAGETEVATMGGVSYNTLADALGETEGGETITLLSNVSEDVEIYNAVTIDLSSHCITGSIDVYADLTLTNGTVKGNVKVDGGTFTMTAPADAEAAIDGGLNVVSGSCDISGAKVGVKGTLYFDGTDMTITGTEKAVALDKAAEPTSKTFYGAATVNGNTTEEAKFEDGTYKVNDVAAKKLSNQPVGSSTTPAVNLTITPETANVTAGKTATFTVTYDGKGELNAYVQKISTNDNFVVSQESNGSNKYTITVEVKETASAGDYTLYVHEEGNAFVQAKATITVTVNVAVDNLGKHYTSIKDAIKGAPDGGTITVIAAANQIPLPNGIYVDKILTLDLNGHSLDNFPLNVGGYNRTGKLTVIDTEGGNGAVGVAVREGGTLVFKPGNDHTALLQLVAYGGTVQLYSGRILKSGWQPYNGVTLADLLPAEGGFAYYREGGAKLTIEQATSASYNLVVKSCDHGGANGFDINSLKCPDCGAPAVAYTQLNLPESAGNSWRNFADLQAALDADRVGSSVVGLLTDVSGEYTIDGSTDTGIDLSGHSLNGTVYVTGVGEEETAFSNSKDTGSIERVVASSGANLAVSGAAAIIDTLQLAKGATWKNILFLPRNPGYKVYTGYPDLTKYTWYAPEDVSDTLTELTNVTIERLPITSKTLNFKVNGMNVKSVDRGTTVQLCAYCNTSGADVSIYTGEIVGNNKPTYSPKKATYQKIGSSWYYVVDLPCNTIGKYSIYFTATKDGYSVTSSTKTLTVNKATIPNDEITAPTAKTLTYTGQPQELVTAGSVDAQYGEMQYSLKRTTGFSTEIPTKTDAGTYTVFYKVVGNNDYKDSTVKSFKVTIDPMKINHAKFSKDISKTYDGTAAFDLAPADKASYLTFEDAHMRPISVPVDAYEISDVRFVAENADHEYVDSPDVGNKAIHFTVTFKNSNYVLQADYDEQPALSKTYNQSGGAKFTINKATVTQPAEITQLVFNDLAKTYTIDLAALLPELSAGCEYGKIQYQGCNYHFTDSTYLDSSNNMSVSKEGILTLPTVSAHTANVNTQIGTITVPVVTTNYQRFEFTIKVFIGAKIQLDQSGVTVSAAEITYGQTLAESVLTATGSMICPRTQAVISGTFAWKDNTIKPDAGSYDAEWVFTPDAPEYATATGKVTVKVNKAASSVVTDPVANTLTYNGGEQALVTAGTASGGAMQYRLGDSGEFTDAIPTAINAGTYTVYYKVAGDSNHNDTTARSVTVTIEPKELTITGVTVADKIYDGTTAATITGVTFDGLQGSDTLTSGTDYTASGAFTDTNAGTNKTVTANVTLKTSVKNYTLTNGTYQQSGCTINRAPAPAQTTELQLYVTNDLAKDYDIDLAALMPTLTSPRAYGNIGYAAPDIDLPNAYCTGYIFGNNTLTLKIKQNPVTSEGHIGTVSITVYTTNYEDITLTVSVFARNKIVPELDGTVSASAITYGQTLADSTITLNGAMRDNATTRAEVPGTFTWKDSTIKPNVGDEGKYEAEWVFTPDAPEYAAATGKVTVTVNKAVFTNVSVQQVGTLTYNGQPQKADVEAKATPVDDGSSTYFRYTTDISHGYYAAFPTFTDAGQYTVYYIVDDVNQNHEYSRGKLTVTILPKTLDQVTIELSGNQFTYTGSGIEPTVTVKDGETVISDSQYTVSYKNNTNVGTATVTVTSKENGNYVFSGSTTFEITTSDSSVTTAPTAKDLTYTGNAQELVTAGIASGGTMKYRLGTSGDFSTDIPTATNAGTYTVYYMVQGDSNHKDTAAQSVEVIIKAKTVDNPTIIVNGGPFVYTGSGIEPTVTVKDGETVIPADQYTVSYKDNTNVGTATVTVTSKDNVNYVFSGSTTFEIVKADSSATAPTANDLTYTGSAQELVTAGTASGGTMKYRLGDSGEFTETIPTATNAGIYTVYYMVAGDSNHKDTAPQNVTVIIKAKTVSEPTIIVEDGPFVYTGDEIKPTVTVKDSETVISASQYTVSYKDNTNVGTATVTVTSNNGGNYDFTGTATFEITTSDSSVTAAPKANDLTYNGSAQELVTAGIASGGTMKYRLGTSGDFSTDIPTATNAGTYTVYYMVQGDSNHKDTAAQSVEVTIAKAKLADVSVRQDGTLTYNGKEQTPTVITAASAYGKNEVAFTFSTEENGNYTDAVPAFTNADDYTVYYKAAADNHETFSGSFTVTIEKAKLENVSVSQRNELTYNGGQQTVEVDTSATTVDGSAVTFTYSMEQDGTYGDLPTFTNAGSFTVWYKAEADNHETFIGSFTVTIEKAIVTVTALDKSAYVGSKAPDLRSPVEDTDYTVSDLFGDDQLTGTIKLTYVDNDGNEIVPSTSNSGEFIIRASGLTAPNENYAVVFVDGTLTVSRRPSSGGSGRSDNDYVIKVVAGEGGSISPSGDVGVRKGEDLTFTITPDDGYAVADIKIDGKSIGAARSYTFKDINASHTIEVSFVKAIGAPLTGDSSNMPLWIALLFVSVCGLTGTTLYKRRKRTQ